MLKDFHNSMTLPKDVIDTLKTLSDQEIVRRYGLPKHSIEIARRHHGIPSPPAKASIQARVVRLLKSGPKTTREVAAALPEVSRVEERLRIMVAKGAIFEDRHGRFTLTAPDAGAELLTKRQRKVVAENPAILDPHVPLRMAGAHRQRSARAIRKALGIVTIRTSAVGMLLDIIVKPMTIPEIRAALAPRPLSQHALGVHVKRGRLRRVGHGIYAPAKDPT